jgi:hypothetical protein
MRGRNLFAVLSLLVALGACSASVVADSLLKGFSGEQPTASTEGIQDSFLPRLAIKREVAQRVLAEEMTLLEAAAQFRKANQLPGQVADHSLAFVPGRTEEERLCRQVIAWVSSTSGQQDSDQEATVARLNSELDEHLVSNARLSLPEVELVMVATEATE